MGIKFISFILIFIFKVSFSQALEIDEKLTARFLKVSQTKKTVLINRGLEDGLVVGDHAKFFLTTGVVARGVVVKASPTRSIWSIYRIIDGGLIFGDKVVNLKISNPLKITDDPSKSLTPEKFVAGQTETMSIPIAHNGEEVQVADNLTTEEREDMESLGKAPLAMDGIDSHGVHTRRQIEVWGMLHMNQFSVDVDRGETSGKLDGKLGNIDFSLGVEKYFRPNFGLLSKLSFSALVHKSSTQTIFTTGETANTLFEYGLAASWHFMAGPLAYGRMIGFFTFGGGIGSTTDIYSTEINGNSSETTAKGSLSFIYAGLGAKYFLRNGFGARITMDIYNRAEELTCDVTPCAGSTDDAYTKSILGPRVQLGISYRF